jgi:hypothetical protein
MEVERWERGWVQLQDWLRIALAILGLRPSLRSAQIAGAICRTLGSNRPSGDS